jgi:hypothetical protein
MHKNLDILVDIMNKCKFVHAAGQLEIFDV